MGRGQLALAVGREGAGAGPASRDLGKKSKAMHTASTVPVLLASHMRKEPKPPEDRVEKVKGLLISRPRLLSLQGQFRAWGSGFIGEGCWWQVTGLLFYRKIPVLVSWTDALCPVGG